MTSIEVRDVMKSLSLGKYAKALHKRGWDDVEHLMRLDEAGLRKVASSAKMKAGHESKFVHALLKLGEDYKFNVWLDVRHTRALGTTGKMIVGARFLGLSSRELATLQAFMDERSSKR